MIPQTDSMGFEITTCSRCHGTGTHSYCQRYGTTCFKCRGKKVVRSIRGAAAYQRYTDSLKVEAGTLVVGDRLHVSELSFSGDTETTYFATITDISAPHEGGKSLQPDGTWKTWKSITISTIHPKRGNFGWIGPPDGLVRKAWSTDENAERLRAALEYQASLTKAGTPALRGKTAKAS